MTISLFAAPLGVFAAALLLTGQNHDPVYSRAAEALQRGQPEQAIAVLEPLVAQAPNDLRALTLLGMALSASGNPDAANRRFLDALRVKPGFVPALRGLAMNYMSAGQIREAKARFAELVKLDPREPMAHLALGEIHFSEKAYLASARHFEQSGGVLYQDPANVLKYAIACANSKQEEKAAGILAKLPPDAGPALHYEAGLLLVRANRFADAIPHFASAAPRHSDPYAAGYNLALAQLKANRPADAASTIEQMSARGFRKAEMFNLLSRSYEASGKTREAYEALRTAIEIDPADETNYIDLIALCLDHRNFDLAAEVAAIGIKRLPGADRLRLQQGVVHAMKGQFPEARASFAESAKLAPTKSLPRVSLGLVLLQMDKTGEAVELLRQAAATSPSDYLVLWFFAEAISRAGAPPFSPEGKEALRAIAKSVRLHGDLAESRLLLAKMLTRTGDLPGAASHLEHALKLDPGHVGAMYQLAQILSKRGDTTRAKELFAKVSKAKAEEHDQFTARGLQRIVREGSR